MTGQLKEDGRYTSTMNAEISYGNVIENVAVIGFGDSGTGQILYLVNTQ